MRHNVDFRKLGRKTEHRIAMLRNQAVSLIKHDRIKTTLAKAKELRRFVERLITLAKKDTLYAKRLAAKDVHDKEALRKLFTTLGPLYANRNGGYTRIIRVGYRRGDNAEEAIIELVGREPKFVEKGKKAEKEDKKKIKEAVEERKEETKGEVEEKKEEATIKGEEAKEAQEEESKEENKEDLKEDKDKQE